jgi:hypothetical protein
MAKLDFMTELSFECANHDAGDVTFIKATCSIGGWDAVEEYMAWGLFPLVASFGLGEIADGETLVSKILLPLLEFPVARLADETDDRFHARVELAAQNVMGT